MKLPNVYLPFTFTVGNVFKAEQRHREQRRHKHIPPEPMGQVDAERVKGYEDKEQELEPYELLGSPKRYLTQNQTL